MNGRLCIHDLPTPVLLLDWSAAQRNISRAAAFVQGRSVQLRPHFKNHKCLPLAKAQLAAGGCAGMTAATVEEAKALVTGGVENVLIANQVVGPTKVAQLVELSTQAEVRVAIDSLANALPIAEAAVARSSEVGVLIELDVGMGRCGVLPGLNAFVLAERLADLKGLRFDGIQAYEANAICIVDRSQREMVALASIGRAIETRQALLAAGHRCKVLSAAGTGTYHVVGQLPGVDELQIGSYVTMDWSYQEKVEGAFDLALSVLATVISTSADRFVLDVGAKGVGHEFGPPRIWERPEFEIPYFGSEEHTIVRAPDHGVLVGQRLRLIPSHCCTTCNMYRQMVVHDDQTVLDVWPISAAGYSIQV